MSALLMQLKPILQMGPRHVHNNLFIRRYSSLLCIVFFFLNKMLYKYDLKQFENANVTLRTWERKWEHSHYNQKSIMLLSSNLHSINHPIWYSVLVWVHYMYKDHGLYGKSKGWKIWGALSLQYLKFFFLEWDRWKLILRQITLENKQLTRS